MLNIFTNPRGSIFPGVIFSLFLMCHLAYSQTSLIKGVITSGDQEEPVPGALVVVKGTQRGTVSENDGSFSIEASVNETLVISFIGFTTKEVLVSDLSQKIKVNLEMDESELDEVVVIGYGTQKKSDLTGSVGSVGEDDLKERPAASLSNALSGKIQGVNVSVNSGRPGGRANIRIRGNTAYSDQIDPLSALQIDPPELSNFFGQE